MQNKLGTFLDFAAFVQGKFVQVEGRGSVDTAPPQFSRRVCIGGVRVSFNASKPQNVHFTCASMKPPALSGAMVFFVFVEQGREFSQAWEEWAWGSFATVIRYHSELTREPQAEHFGSEWVIELARMFKSKPLTGIVALEALRRCDPVEVRASGFTFYSNACGYLPFRHAGHCLFPQIDWLQQLVECCPRFQFCQETLEALQLPREEVLEYRSFHSFFKMVKPMGRSAISSRRYPEGPQPAAGTGAGEL